MTQAETGELMALIAEEHPKFMDTPNPEKRLELWEEAFRRVPYELVEFAVKRMLIESPYTPKLADVVQRIKETLNSEDDATEAWNALRKAASRASVITAAEFEVLPYEVRKFCGNMSGLWDLGMLEADILNSVTRGQFMKIFDTLKRRRETQELMPPELKALIGGSVNSVPRPKRLTDGDWNSRRNEQIERLERAAAPV